jgi:hypothetical protein
VISRRAFLESSGALLIVPLAVEAQQPSKVHRIRLLTGNRRALDNLRQGRVDLGHHEGQTFVIEQRDVEGHFERVRDAVESLVKLPVDVFVVGGS